MLAQEGSGISSGVRGQLSIRRTFDATELNGIANDPGVRPWLLGDGPIDLTAVVADPLNFALVADGGGFVMINAGAGDYEVHSIFRRGAKTAHAAMLAGFDYMFARTDVFRREIGDHLTR